MPADEDASVCPLEVKWLREWDIVLSTWADREVGI